MNVGETRSEVIWTISFYLTSQCVVDVDFRTLLYNIDVLAVVNKMLGIVRVMNYRYKLMNLFV